MPEPAASGRRRRAASRTSNCGLGRTLGVRPAALRARARRRRARPVAPGDRGQPRRLHPVHALRARLPRGAGQRRDRLRVPRRARRRSCSTSTTRWARSTCVACGECVQACPTGALMPARGAGLAGGRSRRSTRCARTAASAASSPTTSRTNTIVARRGPRRPGQPRPAVRQGPLRLRLRAPPAAPDAAADPPRRRAPRIRPTSRSTRRLRCDVFREASWDEALDVAAGGLTRDPRHARRRSRSPASARPRAATRRPTCSRSWCAPASAATTSTTARGCATPRASARAARRHRLGRGVATRCIDVTKAERDPGDRRQPDRRTTRWRRPGSRTRCKRGTKLIVADPRAHRPRAPRLAHAAVHARHRRGAAQRDDDT